jgi:hypothetical protein
MEAFRFQNRNRRKKVTGISIIISLFSVFVIIGFFGKTFKPLTFFLAAVISFIGIMFQIRKASFEFEELLIYDEYLKLYHQNKMKLPIEAKINELVIEISSDKITISSNKDQKLLGYALKESIESQDKWDILVKLLT